MEFSACLLFVLLATFSANLLVQAQDQSGFISLDCGLPGDSSYNDPETEILYSSDAYYIDTGKSMTISRLYDTISTPKQFYYLRSFPDGNRSCYNIKPPGRCRYLLRASFMYGNYDGQNKPPQFELHLGSNLWDTVSLENESMIIRKETILNSKEDQNYLFVCLVNTNLGTPFLSALELRPLECEAYFGSRSAASADNLNSGYCLSLLTRVDVASSTNQAVRYKDDPHDRIWMPYNHDNWTRLNTQLTLDANNSYNLRQTVMMTAATPSNANNSLDFYIDTANPISKFYVFLHFAELQRLQSNQSREFNIFLNEEILYGPFRPEFLAATTIYNVAGLNVGKNKFSLSKTENSTLPPILNALEVYTAVEFSLPETSQQDVDVMMKIKSSYGMKSNWQGDPCAPQNYLWDGLNCNSNGSDPPRIISLNLSSRGLTEGIPSYISNLTAIRSLDLSFNQLSGPIPETLSHLSSLMFLDLMGNNLSGSLPNELIEKWRKGSLSLRVGGNPYLRCAPMSCDAFEDRKKKRNYVVPLVASLGTLMIVMTLLAIMWKIKRRTHANGNVDVRTYDLLEPKDQRFAYAEVCRITNNFEKVLGKGGFGIVYHGVWGKNQVAVKILSSSSAQGYKQFQAEVKTLLRVHHGSLTTLVGYCNDGINMGLIYEYMANGDLREYLSSSSSRILSWEERIHIAMEAAQGLEYLHHGCKPPIVHRDVKTTNILLSDKLEAKLADFGLSKTFPIEGGSHISTAVAGTLGYLDPEYHASSKLTEKSDVYSFGVVLLEIISGRSAVTKTKDDEPIHISRWVSSVLENGDITDVVDPRLHGDFDTISASKAVELAMACLFPVSSTRPSMIHAVIELNGCLLAEKARKQEQETRSKGSTETNNSTDSFPISIPEAR